MPKRIVASAATWAVGFALLLPLAALLATAVIDIGPGPASVVRISPFPLVLTAYDTITWASIGNSVAIAAIVACGSLVGGVPLGRLITRWRFWGRPLFFGLLAGSAVIPPAFSALGLLGLLDPSGPGVWQKLAQAILAPAMAERSWPWLVWVWAALIQGTALVILATTSALDALDPAREDAARLIGASPRRIWWSFTWPSIRPAIAPVVHLVFMLTLADPGAPLVLGLRRTLGFQIVFAAIRSDPFPRIAGLCLVVLTITLAWRKLVLWWGRAGLYPDVFRARPLERSRQPAPEAAWPRAHLFCLILPVCAILAWLPCLGLAAMSLAAESAAGSSQPRVWPGVLGLLRRLTGPPAPALLVHSAVLGLGVAVLLWMLASWWPRQFLAAPMPRWKRIGSVLTTSVPPLVVGVSVLSLSRLAGLVSLWLRPRLEWTGTAAAIELAAKVLDPCGVPGLALYLGVCLAHLPSKLLASLTLRERGQQASHRIDQALLAGSKPRRSRALGLRRSGGVSARSIVLWSMLAATGIAPAIVLAPTMEGRPVGPGILILADRPEGARAQAAALALTMIALNLAALAWCWVGRLARKGPARAAGLAAAELL